MTDVNIFEYATRRKLRFNYKGTISVEDLWDLSVEVLDKIFKHYNKQKKELDDEESLINSNLKGRHDDLIIMIEILKYIVAYKQKVEADNLKALEKAQKKHQLMQLIADKENAELKDKSIDELKELLADL